MKELLRIQRLLDGHHGPDLTPLEISRNPAGCSVQNTGLVDERNVLVKITLGSVPVQILLLTNLFEVSTHDPEDLVHLTIHMCEMYLAPDNLKLMSGTSPRYQKYHSEKTTLNFEAQEEVNLTRTYMTREKANFHHPYSDEEESHC